MQKLMAIFAHPDDEGAVSGTLARTAANETEVMLVCGTIGEVGEINDPALATPENLGQVRGQEAMAAHKTQFSEEHMFRKVPKEVMIEATGSEYFIQVYHTPQDELREKPLMDLFSVNGDKTVQ